MYQEEEQYLKRLTKDNPFIEVKHTPGMGRGVFAKTGIVMFIDFNNSYVDIIIAY